MVLAVATLAGLAAGHARAEKPVPIFAAGNLNSALLEILHEFGAPRGTAGVRPFRAAARAD